MKEDKIEYFVQYTVMVPLPVDPHSWEDGIDGDFDNTFINVHIGKMTDVLPLGTTIEFEDFIEDYA